MTRDQEVLMFGCTVEQLRNMVQSDMYIGGPSAAVISILSDVQELISLVSEASIGDADESRLELARQYINQAKFFVMEYLRNSQ